MEQWKGKVAIITGASTGIGAAIAIELVKYGVQVVALARRKDKLEELAESLNGKGTIHTKVCDVTDEQAVIDVFSWVDSTLGGPSILINNAGAVNVSSLLNGNLKDWQDTFNLNVLALSVCSREACKSMKKNKIDGHIVHINSVIGHNISSYFGMKMYNASKHAVTVLCDGLRHELQLTGSKIKVTSLSPGPVYTELLLSVQKSLSNSEKLKLNYEILKVEDVVNAVIASLATPPSVLIAEMIIIPTGATIQTHCQPNPQVVENVLNL